jgi:hypothetical protein
MTEDIEQLAAPSPTFDGHLGEDQPNYLFHYTTMSGALGIVTSSELWATKIQYMNDATEFGLALDIAERRIETLSRETRDDEIRDKISKLFPRRKGIAGINLFVSCFCENGDLLSQWRGYSAEGNGYSLKVKTSALVWNAKNKNFEIGKCIYDRDMQQKIIDELIYNSISETSEKRRTLAFEKGIMRVGVFFKDQPFSEENEWRIVSGPTSIRAAEVDFRVGRSMLIPYFKVPIGTGNKSAISEAIIGPCPHPELSKSSLTMLLIREGIKRAEGQDGRPIEIRNSSIPYRNW